MNTNGICQCWPSVFSVGPVEPKHKIETVHHVDDGRNLGYVWFTGVKV
jgi:hypothetical protein